MRPLRLRAGPTREPTRRVPVKAILLTALVTATVLAGCTGGDLRDPTHAVMNTSLGCIILELYPNDAPETVDNFARYAEDDFYQGTIFHRIVPGFVVQGGGFTPDGREKDTRAPIPLETERSNLQWTLSMARTNDPNSATSQFYINLDDNSESLDRSQFNDGYAVFGAVIAGQEVVQAMANLPTGNGPRPGLSDWPTNPPVIEDVVVGTQDCTKAGGTNPDGFEPVDIDPATLPTEAVMRTSMGCIVLELYPHDAPITVDNFVRYANDDFYHGTIFHRVMSDFVIQGGGFLEDGTRKETRDPIRLEAVRSNIQWTLSMARTMDPNSATSQFYINVEDNSESLDPRQGSPGYAVFGAVVNGFDVVNEIKQVETGPGPNPGMSDWPVDPVTIYDVVPGTKDCTKGKDSYTPPAPFYAVKAGTIHAPIGDDGVWDATISSTTDYVPIWILNEGNQPDTFTVDLLAPSRWNVTLSPTTVSLAKGGASNNDAGDAYVITVKADDEAAILARSEPDILEITVRSDNDPDAKAEVRVRLNVDPDGLDKVVTRPGSEVTLDYAGSFDDGEEFDSGSFTTTLGSGQTVAGFDNGLLGLRQGETATLHFPPELGYGYDQAGNRAKFNGEWLTFEVTPKKIA